MKISIRFFGQARQFAGVAQVDVNVDDCASVNDIVAQLVDEGNEQLKAALVDREGRLNTNVLVALKDEAVDPSIKGLLKEGDEIVLHTALAGG